MNTVICYVVVCALALYIHVKGVREDTDPSPSSTPTSDGKVKKASKPKYTTVKSYRRVCA